MNGYDYNTVTPYKVLPHKGILYNPCHDYSHISRYKGLRQVTHITENNNRFMTLEGPNAFTTNSDVDIYEVPTYRENRIDLIANQYLGTASYGWIISNFNDIEDNFTVRVGQDIKIPQRFTDLFNEGEVLASISALNLNLGEE